MRGVLRPGIATLGALVAWTAWPGTGVARADDAHAPTGVAEVHVDAAKRALAIDQGAKHDSVPIELARDEIDAAKSVVERVAIGEGKSVVHARVPSSKRAGVAWEAIVQPGRDPAVVWSGVTGFASGEEGEYTGTALDIAPGAPGGSYVIVGDVREDLGICGQPKTLLAPKVLDPKTMELRGATLQRLDEDRRDDAEEIVASRLGRAADVPLARLLAATGASTAVGAPSAVTDGDPRTTWSEGRPGDGHGEFVTMTAPSRVPIARLAITIAPPDPAPHGAAPQSFYLVTGDRVVHVTMPEDAWMHPGQAYEIALVDPLRTSCLSLVLDKAYARSGEAHPEVTVAELTAYSPFDASGATLDAAAKALNGGGTRAESAMAVLERAGDAGLAAAAKAFPTLDASGRALAIDAAIGAGTCEASAPLLVAAMGDGDHEVARKGREKVARCGKRATGALVDATRGTDMKVRAMAAPMLASIAPSAAIEPLASVLAEGPPATRAAVRAALAKSARGASVDTLAKLVSDGARAPDARLELVRAFTTELPRLSTQADAAIAQVASGAAPTRTRYLLAEPLASLARAGDATATARLAATIATDPDPAIRAHAAESGGGIATLVPTLAAALKDDAPRVREAALHALSDARPLPTPEVAERLTHDDWTFVRAAAAADLASAPPGPAVDGALETALEDGASPVRESAIGALAAHGATHAVPAILARLADEHEALDVRVAGVRATAVLCDRRAVDTLTSLASRAPLAFASETEVQLGLEATAALGRLHPPDLAARLAPLFAKDARAEARTGAERALASPPSCR